jgi:hypothetical protein
MAFLRTFIQQLEYNGTSYTKGSVVDMYDEFGMGVEVFPFKDKPEAKAVASRDWPDEHGLDTYIPSGGLYIKDYDLDVDIICYGSLSDLHNRISRFFDFINGENTNGSPRLAIYDEHVSQGRKDVRYVKNENTLWHHIDGESEKIAEFKVTFHVDDPHTEVTPSFNQTTCEIQSLNW